jgi:alkanesulfonate monooxygenase SsuD/methylene tetrahydromethanopterin reductase-like flavin-dependent oxidoreductase (luciferase family)
MTVTTHRGAVGPGLTFGLSGLSAHADDTTPVGYHRALRSIVSQAVLAEELGLEAAWVCEHHFTESGYLPAPFVALAALAERTEHITLGTDVMLPSMWDPVRFAEEAAVADQLSGGRLILAVGIGYREPEFEGFGYHRRDRVARLTECVRVLREAAGGTVSGVGTLPSGTSVPLSPLPFQDGGPPVWGGGKAEGAVRRARRIGDGYFASLMGTDGLDRRIGWLDDEAPIDDDFALAQTTLCFLAPTTAEAEDLAAPGMGHLQAESRRWATEGGAQDVDATWKPGDPWQAATPRSPLAPDEQLTHAVIVADPETCIARLTPYVEHLLEAPGSGPRHLSARLTYPKVSPADNERSLRLFATEVVPALRALAP